jgi:hypothetical protein
MNWINIDSDNKVKEIKDLSQSERVLVFLYDRGRSVDYIIKLLFEREWDESAMRMKAYLAGSDYFNKAADEFNAVVESPQILIIEKGNAVFSASNGKALVENIKQFAN